MQDFIAQPAKILIADSDSVMRSGVIEAVHQAFHIAEILEATNAEEARSLISSVDLLLTSVIISSARQASANTMITPFGENAGSDRDGLMHFAESRGVPSILYGHSCPYSLWPDAFAHSLFAPQTELLAPGGVLRFYHVLRRLDQPRRVIECAVEFPGDDNEGMEIRFIAREGATIFGSDLYEHRIKISKEDASRLRECFARCTRAGCRLEGGDEISLMLKEVLYTPELRRWLDGKLGRDPTDAAICFNGNSRILAYPLDLIRLRSGGHEFMSGERLVVWSINDDDSDGTVEQRQVRTTGLNVGQPLAALVLGNGNWGSLNVGGETTYVSTLKHVADEITHIKELLATRVPDAEDGVVCAMPNGRQVHVEGIRSALSQLRSRRDDGRINLLHFCGHGVMDSKHPDHSGPVVLAGDERDENGMTVLTIRDLLDALKKRDGYAGIDLAFFNCCVLGSVRDGEKPEASFYGSFVEALTRLPADYMICHRWDISDCLSRHFAKHFYEHRIRHGLPLHVAFHKAKSDIGFARDRVGLHGECTAACRHKGTVDFWGEHRTGNLGWLAPVLIVRAPPWEHVL